MCSRHPLRRNNAQGGKGDCRKLYTLPSTYLLTHGLVQFQKQLGVLWRGGRG